MVNKELDTLIELLDEDVKRDLTIEQLNILYEIDEDISDCLHGYRICRNMFYEDFVKLFGEDKVVKGKQELININTLAFVGNIFTYGEFDTYNLRYVSGNFMYYGVEIDKLDNLEIIYGDGYFDPDHDIPFSGLDNLRSVYGCFQIHVYDYSDSYQFPYYVKELGLGLLTNMDVFKKIEEIHGLETLILDGAEVDNATIPNKIKKIYTSNMKSMTNTTLPSNLEIFEGKEISNIKGVTLPNTIEKLSLGITSYGDLVLPENLKELELPYLKMANKIICPSNLKVLSIPSIEYVLDIEFSPTLEKLVINNNANINKVKFPSYIEELEITKSNCSDSFRVKDIPLDKIIEVAYYNKFFEIYILKDICKNGLTSVGSLVLPNYPALYFAMENISPDKVKRI